MTDLVPASKEAPAKTQTQFKILDVRPDDVMLELEDGRVIPATLGDSINPEDVKRHRLVNIKFDGLDSSDAPKGAIITRVLPKE